MSETPAAQSISAQQLRNFVDQVEGGTPLRVSDLIAEMVAIERWALVPGYSAYLVSSWGGVCRRETGRALAQTYSKGYQHVCLSEGGKARTHRVARLVALTFLGPEPFPGAIVAHNDGTRNNNRLDNLRWATPLDNQWDRDRHGSRVLGANVFGAKLTEDRVRDIRNAIASGERYPSISVRHGVSVSAISLIKLGRTWRHVQ